MRVLVCPDKFGGTLSAVEAAQALAAGWREGAPQDRVLVRPLADGGPGFIDVLAEALSAGGATVLAEAPPAGGADVRREAVETVDPLGRPARGQLLLADGVCYIESAHACGLHLLAPAERDPKATTSYGLGQLLAVAVETGARRVVVGLGGSATNDAGAGMLAALGAPPIDQAGYALPYGGAALLACAGLAGAPRLRGVELVAATDVDNPLTGPHGASSVYGPQKGASRDDVLLLDAALERFAAVLAKELPTCPPGLAGLPGAGAAGGLGAAILALGGRCESGIGLVRRLVRLDEALDDADLVVTGEGSFDQQSLRGKVVAGVAAAARERGLPCLVVAGQVSVARQEAAAAGVTQAHSLAEHLGGVEAALARPAEGLRSLARALAAVENWAISTRPASVVENETVASPRSTYRDRSADH